MQLQAAIITAIGVLVVLVCFVVVLRNAGKSVPLDDVAPGAYRVRGILFWVALIAGVLIAYKTLVPWPHTAAPEQASRSVRINSAQWSWTLPEGPINVGDRVDFTVESADVNHGFGLYSPEGKLVTQVQAMPGFINKVSYTFTAPGKYKVLCMEYCGLGHHRMDAELLVSPK